MEQLTLGLDIQLTNYQKSVQNIFGETWYNRLGAYLNTEHKNGFKNKLLPAIAKEYNNYTCFPEKKNIFRVYREVPSPKVVMIGQSPYSDSISFYEGEELMHRPQATGRAFECNNNLSPSLKTLLEQSMDVNSSIIPFDPVPIDKWIMQGVMPLNSVLSIRSKDNNSHQDMGYKYLLRVTLDSILNENMVFMFYGSKAQSLITPQMNELAKEGSIYIHRTVHPAAMNYPGNEDLEFDNGFNDINNYLISKNIEPINWDIGYI